MLEFYFLFIFEQVWSYVTGSFSLCCVLSAGWVRLRVWEQFTSPWLPTVPHLCRQRPLHHLRILLQGETQPLPPDPELKHCYVSCSQMSCHWRCHFCFNNIWMFICNCWTEGIQPAGKASGDGDFPGHSLQTGGHIAEVFWQLRRCRQ